MATYCDTCSAWRLRQCDGCEYFTGNYPPDRSLDQPARRAKKIKKKRRPSGLRYTKHGLSPEQQDDLLKQQHNKCSTCGKRSDLVLDHDHSTGKARGYVCGRCNFHIIGHEDKKLSAKIDRYLENPPADRYFT